MVVTFKMQMVAGGTKRLGANQVTGQVGAEVNAQVTAEVAAQVLAFCQEPKPARITMADIGLKHWKTFQSNYLNPLLDSGWLERTIPEKPRSRLKRYRTTEKRLSILADKATEEQGLPLIRHMADRKQEHFICISLNGANEVIATRTLSVGLVNRTQVHPREVFADPITDRASAIIVAHNHPAGDLTPSGENIQITQQLKIAGEAIGIKLLDHIIFSHKGYFSFIGNGQL